MTCASSGLTWNTTPDAGERRQAQRAGEAEGMEEGKDAEDAIAVVQMEDLLDLFDVGGKIEMRKHHALGFARGAAGENDCGGVIEAGRLRDAQEQFQKAARERASPPAARRVFSPKRGFSARSSAVRWARREA